MDRIRKSHFVIQADSDTTRHSPGQVGVAVDGHDALLLARFYRKNQLGFVMPFGVMLVLLVDHTSLTAEEAKGGSAKTNTILVAPREAENSVETSAGKQNSTIHSVISNAA